MTDQHQAADEGAGEEILTQEKKYPDTETSCDTELQEFHEHHRRLLPNFKNAIHVIDGADRRYFVGIIDIFTVYSVKKRLENLWKNLRFPGRAFSTVRPLKYSQRFCRWIQEHTQWLNVLFWLTIQIFGLFNTLFYKCLIWCYFEKNETVQLLKHLLFTLIHNKSILGFVFFSAATPAGGRIAPVCLNDPGELSTFLSCYCWMLDIALTRFWSNRWILRLLRVN